jgi:NAD(P)H-hydrate repair Nnr-like enzyme with NAD(P)H-hydrate dehydratase domain
MLGLLGLFCAWASGSPLLQQNQEVPSTMLACAVASVLTRWAAREAFHSYHRSTLTTHILQVLPSVMQQVFPVTPAEDGNKVQSAKM